MSIGSFLGGIAKGTYKVGKLGVSGTINRTIFGAGIGAAYAAFTSNKNDPNQQFGSIARGALAGGLAGLGINLFKPRNMAAIARGAFSTRNLSTMRSAGNVLGAGAGLALRYPSMALGVGASLYALNRLNKSPHSSRNRDAFQNSTTGLPFGLHRSRHG